MWFINLRTYEWRGTYRNSRYQRIRVQVLFQSSNFV